MMQISDTVYPMYKAFIEPDLKTAHLKIYNTFNPFSGGSVGFFPSSSAFLAKMLNGTLFHWCEPDSRPNQDCPSSVSLQSLGQRS